MTIEILYVAGCPHVQAAMEMVRRALAAEGLASPLQMILVRDQSEAQAVRFAGSPTIRVCGEDVMPDDGVTEVCVGCRLYRNPENPGLPREESVRSALRRAVERGMAR